MQETFTVTVTTEDGKCLIQRKIIGTYSSLCSELSLLSGLFEHLWLVTQESEIGPGSGTGQSASDSSLPTQS